MHEQMPLLYLENGGQLHVYPLFLYVITSQCLCPLLNKYKIWHIGQENHIYHPLFTADSFLDIEGKVFSIQQHNYGILQIVVSSITTIEYIKTYVTTYIRTTLHFCTMYLFFFIVAFDTRANVMPLIRMEGSITYDVYP